MNQLNNVADMPPMDTILYSVSNALNTDLANQNELYRAERTKLCNAIKQCHNLLYSNCSVVGTKAQNDIMRILSLVILRPYFVGNRAEIVDRCNATQLAQNISNEKMNKYKLFCADLMSLAKKDAPLNEWRNFVSQFLVHVLPNIYCENDSKFACNDEKTIIQIIEVLSSLDISAHFIDAYSTTCGDIYEAFRAYGGGKGGSKELGQYFTPRHLIHIIIAGTMFGRYISTQLQNNISAYDCCAGTAGLLTRLFQYCNQSGCPILPSSIYGCETEPDTIKFGALSVLLTSQQYNPNIIKCDSLCQNPFLFTKKCNVIFTNPPFGTKMTYTDLQSKFNDYKAKNGFDTYDVAFEDIYPVKVNNGACLFIQHCVYMLETGGICAVVLPDGELFIRKSFQKFRKWLCDTVCIQQIVKVPAGVFEHAGVKTNVLIFTKVGLTTKLEYIKTNKECTMMQYMFSVNRDQIVKAGYSFDVTSYMEAPAQTVTSAVPMVELRDILVDCPTTHTIKTEDRKDGEYEYYSCSKYASTSNEYHYSGEHLIQASKGSILDALFYTKKPFAVSYNLIISQVLPEKRDLVSLKYVYAFLKFNRQLIKISGSGPPTINKETYYSIAIPLPSVETQMQIVEHLSQLEENRRTIQLRIDQLQMEEEMYKKYAYVAELQAIHSNNCVVKTLIEVCEINIGGTPRRDTPSYWENGVHPWVSIREMENNIIYNTKERITDLGVSESNVKLIPANTILFSFKLSIGKMAISGCDLYTNEAIAGLIIRNNPELPVDMTYLYYYLKELSSFNASGCIGGGSLNKESLSKLIIRVPKEEADMQKCVEIYKLKNEHSKQIGARIESESERMNELMELGRHIINALCTYTPTATLTEDSTVAPNATLTEDSTVEPNATLAEDSTVEPSIKITPRKKKVTNKVVAPETNNK